VDFGAFLVDLAPKLEVDPATADAFLDGDRSLVGRAGEVSRLWREAKRRVTEHGTLDDLHAAWTGINARLEKFTKRNRQLKAAYYPIHSVCPLAVASPSIKRHPQKPRNAPLLETHGVLLVFRAFPQFPEPRGSWSVAHESNIDFFDFFPPSKITSFLLALFRGLFAYPAVVSFFFASPEVYTSPRTRQAPNSAALAVTVCFCCREFG
jgi:hypothetical protein